MRRIKEFFKMARLFLRLVFEMLRNYRHLDHDIDNNYQICKKICDKVIKSAKIQLHTVSSEHVPEEETFLLVSNHRCFFDVVFLISAVKQTISFVAAKELFHYPILNKYLNSIQCISLDRYNTEVKKLKESIATMKSALEVGNLVLFPEGECSYHDTRMKTFKKGGFLGLPRKDQCILPVYIKIGQLQNIGRWMIPQGDVYVHFGNSFSPLDMPNNQKRADDIAKYSQNCIIQLQDLAN